MLTLLFNSYTKAVDCWALGVILYVLVSGHLPFDASHQLRAADCQASFPQTEWRGVSEECKDLVRGLLHTNEWKRHTAAQVLQHPWCKHAARRAVDERTPRRAADRWAFRRALHYGWAYSTCSRYGGRRTLRRKRCLGNWGT